MRITFLIASAAFVHSALAQSTPFTIDPATVVREGAGYKYPRAGWWIVHVEGAPYERGVQHGKLLAEEIAGNLRCLAQTYSPTAPDEGMRLLRTIVNSLFLRGFEREYLEEMKGIADGAAGSGAKFGERAVDLTDIVALNVWAELGCLEDGLAALPTGLEGVRFPEEPGSVPKPTPAGHCSAFAATGPATADGHAIIGHITMFSLYPSNFYNIWLDVAPDKGHHFAMQSFPGGIQSSMDYYQNDAGMVLVETTIDQTRFEKNGLSLASRVRQAIQYGDSIDSVVALLNQPGNGLYTNEWILADMNTDEIAMFELGTHTSRLYRSGPHGKGTPGSPADWFAGTEGFYWGCNNTKDLSVRIEGVASVADTPHNMVWHPSDRDAAWMKLYAGYKGRMDGEFAKLAFTTRPICGSPSLDAKFTTSEMAPALKAWGTFGPPRGMTWEPTFDERKKYPEIRALVSNPWTVLESVAPERPPLASADLAPSFASAGKEDDDKPERPLRAAWRGTLLPKTDGDIWLAASFAEYQQMVSEEQGLAAAHDDKCLCDTDHDKAASSLYAARARYLSAARASRDVPLVETKRRYDSQDWYDIAAGKGALVLSELRLLMGDGAFMDTMDDFGRLYAGQEVRTADFVTEAGRASGKDLSPFFDYWLRQTGMPRLMLKSARLDDRRAEGQGGGDDGPVVHGELVAEGGPLPTAIEVTAEWEDGETTRVVVVEPASGRFSLVCDQRPARVIVDKYGRSARANGGAASITSFSREIEKSIIVYGTRDDEAGNRDAAEKLQRSLQQSWFNFLVPVKSDREVSDGDLAQGSMVLVGRPSTNTVAERGATSLPVAFGPRSFKVRETTYGHPRSAVLAAGVNPWNPGASITIVAGNSAESTVSAALRLRRAPEGAEIVVLLRDGQEQPLVAPAHELTRDFGP